jgi:hypothetical protein
LKKEVSGAGEGISIQISCKSANIEIQRDTELYKLLESNTLHQVEDIYGALK